MQEQGEGGVVAKVLQLALGAVHGGVLRGPGAGVELGLLGPLVGEDKADVGLVAAGGGNAGVDIHVVVNGDIVVALGGDGHIPLAEDGVEKAVVVHAVVVVLLGDEIGVVEVIHPRRHLLIVLALTGDGVDQHAALHIHAAEEADGLYKPCADPVGGPLLVHLHHRLGKHEGGVTEPKMAVEVPAEVLGGGVLDALLKAHQLHALVHHVDNEVGREAVGTVGDPLDDVRVAESGNAHRPTLVVNLGVVLIDLKLADHIAELPQLPVPQPLGAVLVQHGNLVVGDLIHLGNKVPRLNGQQLGIASGPEDHRPGHAARYGDNQQPHSDDRGDQALLLDKLEVALEPLPLKAGGDNGADTVDNAQQQRKGVKLLRLEVDGRQSNVEIHKPHHQRHHDVQQRSGDGVAHRLAGLLRPRRRGRLLRGRAALKPLPAEAPSICSRKSHNKSPILL